MPWKTEVDRTGESESKQLEGIDSGIRPQMDPVGQVTMCYTN